MRYRKALTPAELARNRFCQKCDGQLQLSQRIPNVNGADTNIFKCRRCSYLEKVTATDRLYKLSA